MILTVLAGAAVVSALAPRTVSKMKGGRMDLSGLSLQELRAIMPALAEADARRYLPHLCIAMNEAEITTPLRRAMFLAQLAHESNQLKWWEEIASGDAYEGRKDLGNTQPGDGRKFKGHGPIQITGRANHRACGAALGLDLETRPELLLLPEVGFRGAGWFWTVKRLNVKADAADLVGATKIINGGTNGLDDRRSKYERACKVLMPMGGAA